ncbi:MAG: phenylalanine--tRNA ligase subunit alpha, partial [Candidatus Latescibacteria bacterium]|nr:phenylalanine--tRNA ligase subunit alpha [Candidatus Latescibacterota bacterium]
MNDVMIEQAEGIEQRARAEIVRSNDLSALEEVRVRYLGKNGQLTQLLRTIGQAPPDARKLIGQRGNQAKTAIEQALAVRRTELERATA